MARIVFEIGGLDRILRDLEEFEREVAAKARELVVDTTLHGEKIIADEISELHVVDTGRLLGSFTGQSSRRYTYNPADTVAIYSPDGLQAVVGTNVEYAVAVHEGYSRRLVRRHRKTLSKSERKIVRAGELLRARLRAQKTGGVQLVGRGTFSVAYFGEQTDTGEQVVTHQVTGRPFMANAIPKIQDYFLERAAELFEGT